MDAHGHEDVSKTAGIPLLQAAFGKDKRSLTALYLGNWLTDVSQAVDPVAYHSASEGTLKGGVDSGVDALKEGIEKFVTELVPSVFRYTPEAGKKVLKSLKSLKPEFEKKANEAKVALHERIDVFLSPQTNDRDARLGQFFRDCFLVKGYFKFVHPKSRKSPPRMDFEGFMRVFGRPGDTRGASEAQPANDQPSSGRVSCHWRICCFSLFPSLEFSQAIWPQDLLKICARAGEG